MSVQDSSSKRANSPPQPPDSPPYKKLKNEDTDSDSDSGNKSDERMDEKEEGVDKPASSKKASALRVLKKVLSPLKNRSKSKSPSRDTTPPPDPSKQSSFDPFLSVPGCSGTQATHDRVSPQRSRSPSPNAFASLAQMQREAELKREKEPLVSYEVEKENVPEKLVVKISEKDMKWKKQNDQEFSQWAVNQQMEGMSNIMQDVIMQHTEMHLDSPSESSTGSSSVSSDTLFGKIVASEAEAKTASVPVAKSEAEVKSVDDTAKPADVAKAD